MQVLSQGWEDSLKQKMATHSSILPWKITDRAALWVTVHGAAKSRIWLSTHTHIACNILCKHSWSILDSSLKHPWLKSVVCFSPFTFFFYSYIFLFLFSSWFLFSIAKINKAPFTFNLCVSLYLKWVSCRQHIVGLVFYFLPQSLLIGASRPQCLKLLLI